uniref:Leucine-rich repeat and immunoglobulin-like domain-containing nogo receptor-interacting protein 2 n=1 Tax=Sipha flava TaxID=143950 RepID=A0A2S2Q266_9HEMI
MKTIMILMFVGLFLFFETEGASNISNIVVRCKYSKKNELLMANCHGANGQKLKTIPDNIMSEVQILKLQTNRIAKLNNRSFVMYPKIKELLLSDNVVHTIKPGSLSVLDKLELLDLSGNALYEVPAGLPKSLVHLNLNMNPIKRMDQLSRAVGLQVLKLSRCGLVKYPALDVMPSLVELDVSGNDLLNDLDPVTLAATCRLSWLNVTGCTTLFQRPESRCRCLSAVKWTRNHNIQVFGMPPCPVANGTSVANKCTAPTALHKTTALFERCMDEWDRRNTFRWSIGLWLVIMVAIVTVPMYVRWRNQRGHSKIVRAIAIHELDSF